LICLARRVLFAYINHVLISVDENHLIFAAVCLIGEKRLIFANPTDTGHEIIF